MNPGRSTLKSINYFLNIWKSRGGPVTAWWINDPESQSEWNQCHNLTPAQKDEKWYGEINEMTLTSRYRI